MHVYAGMMHMEDGPVRKTLSRLAALEKKHALMWKGIVGDMEPHEEKRKSALVSIMLALRRVLGIALVIKLLERRELVLQEIVTRPDVLATCTPKERRTIMGVMRDREKNEDALQATLVEHNPVLTNIRDVIFGMNDGLVELVAATAGLGVVLQSPVLIFVGGLIVAISGTLSMAAGAYLSTEYERSVIAKKARGRATPKKSAAYVGFSYLLGTVFPLLPFALGFGGFEGVGLSIAVTMAALAFVSALISIVSDTRILRRIGISIAVSMGSAAATIALGLFARLVLHLAI